MNKLELFRVLVGSRAHKTHKESADFDYRGVYVLPTSDILSLNYKYLGTSWIEGEGEDNTTYEVGNFIKMALTCHPNILEMFVAPLKITPPTEEEGLTEWRGEDFESYFGGELRRLFPYIWCPNKAFDSFVNYAHNQISKMIANKDNNSKKFAYNYLRVLCNLEILLRTNTFTLEVKEKTPYWVDVLFTKDGTYSVGDTIDLGNKIINKCKVLRDNSIQKQDINEANKLLLKIRKHYWEI